MISLNYNQIGSFYLAFNNSVCILPLVCIVQSVLTLMLILLAEYLHH